MSASKQIDLTVVLFASFQLLLIFTNKQRKWNQHNYTSSLHKAADINSTFAMVQWVSHRVIRVPYRVYDFITQFLSCYSKISPANGLQSDKPRSAWVGQLIQIAVCGHFVAFPRLIYETKSTIFLYSQLYVFEILVLKYQLLSGKMMDKILTGNTWELSFKLDKRRKQLANQTIW